MRTHNIFLWRYKKKKYAYTPSYLELCRITRKTHLGLENAGLNRGVVLFSSGFNSGFLLYCLNM